MTPTDPRHGTRAGQQAHRRAGQEPCLPCLEATRRYNRNRKKLANLGHNLTVDAAPVIAHIEALNAAGVLTAHISTGARTVIRRRPERIHRRTALPILQARAIPGVNCWPILGAMRRLQALSAVGHTTKRMAAELDVAESLVSEIANNSRGWKRLDPDLWRSIDALYRRLWDKPGSDASRRRAARKGWAPPLAWDDIDDPDATPHIGAEKQWHLSVEDIEWFLDQEPTATAARVAERFGLRPDAVQQCARRAERFDLLERLSRNSELAGHNVGRATRKRPERAA